MFIIVGVDIQTVDIILRIYIYILSIHRHTKHDKTVWCYDDGLRCFPVVYVVEP